MGFAQNFSSQQAGVQNGFKIIWSNKVGSFKYFSYILAGFDPIRAEQIWDTRADQIAQAYVSKVCYEFVDIKK
jgi:hypothetical protein